MNSARELDALLARVGNGESPVITRWGNANEGRGAELHVQALRHLVNLWDDLNRLEASSYDSTNLRSHFESWWAAVIQPNQTWNSSANGNNRILINPTSRSVLVLAADIIDAKLPSTPIGPEYRQNASQSLDDLVNLLNDEHFDAHMKAYALGLIHELRTLLDAASVSAPIDLLSKIHQLQGLLGHLQTSAVREKWDNAEGFVEKLRVIKDNLTPAAKNTLGALTTIAPAAAGVITA